LAGQARAQAVAIRDSSAGSSDGADARPHKVRLPIRIKLAIALAVPLVAMGLVTLAEVISLSREARQVRDQTDLAAAMIGPNGLITALQNERTYASAYPVGVEQQVTLEVVGFAETRADTDDALFRFEDELDRRGTAARSAYMAALARLDDLPELRRQVDAGAEAPERTMARIEVSTGFFDAYTEMVEPFFGGMSQLSIAMDDPELRQGARLVEVVTHQLEDTSQLANALAFPAIVSTGDGDAPGFDRPGEIAEVARLHTGFMRQAEQLRTADGPYAHVAEEFYPAEFTQVLDDTSTMALTAGQIDVPRLINGLETPPGEENAYVGYRNALADALQDRADQLNESATSREQRFGLLVVVTLGAAVALTVIVSLSITRPLRSLTTQAKDMAEHRLPYAVAEILETPFGEDVVVPEVSPVRVVTRDEVADVADALNTVQDSALDLAVEQAVLRRNIADSFVNLGRRNQNLLSRQLDFITELETRETEPDSLSNLFRLDHLATRMRRNAESLLVLAGVDPPRRWTAPLRLGDVVRAAVGEVEDFQRVVLHIDPNATIAGAAAADLAHLLAELIENALVFSPPDSTVEVHGVRRPDRYTLAVVDTGLGMPPADIDAANRRLAGAESFTIAPSKYLGHYVAGNLAARHGITVSLRSARGFGVTATVEIPGRLLNAHVQPPWPEPAAIPMERRGRPLPAQRRS
jgi:signal transduction histidine kinase